MDNQPEHTSDARSAMRGIVIIIVGAFLLIGGCAQMEKNGTWQNWANAMEK